MSELQPSLEKYRKNLQHLQEKTKALEKAYEKIIPSSSFSVQEKNSIKDKLIQELKKEKECLRQIEERSKIFKELHEITTTSLEARGKIMKDIEDESNLFEIFPCIKKSFKDAQVESLVKVRALIERNEK